ncbi:hypothetical protein Y1Q_0017992 [Alligator mississippiensis]|uniref:Uncharacterized protein n=1 Tax=Alligator mississippiensis TaxID=8496 RepID=A0A151MY64_ALLMI|nr:hypothetical protein Y1Q_0017992 [Alligator mississippiensis]
MRSGFLHEYPIRDNLSQGHEKEAFVTSRRTASLGKMKSFSLVKSLNSHQLVQLCFLKGLHPSSLLVPDEGYLCQIA